MTPEQDSWSKLLRAWHREDAAANSTPEEDVPLGFSTRVVARWKDEKVAYPAPSWLELWERCAIPGACAAMLGLVALVALGAASEQKKDHTSSGLFVIPDIDMPGQEN